MTFSVFEYIQKLGAELVAAYDMGGMATTPGAKGTSRENAVREKLEQVLPRGTGVGTGFVIDVQGNVSKQMDIILYERDLCPVYKLNNSDEAAYYPCEGVYAVGEVKSTINSQEFKDILAKIESVRVLRRYVSKHREAIGEDIFAPARHYGSTQHTGLTIVLDKKKEEYEQDKTGRHQIIAFGIGKSMTLSYDSAVKLLSEHLAVGKAAYLPNLILELDRASIMPVKGNKISSVSGIEAAGFVAIETCQDGFPLLITKLISAFTRGLTSHEDSYGKYFATLSKEPGYPVLA